MRQMQTTLELRSRTARQAVVGRGGGLRSNSKRNRQNEETGGDKTSSWAEAERKGKHREMSDTSREKENTKIGQGSVSEQTAQTHQALMLVPHGPWMFCRVEFNTAFVCLLLT